MTERIYQAELRRLETPPWMVRTIDVEVFSRYRSCYGHTIGWSFYSGLMTPPVLPPREDYVDT